MGWGGGWFGDWGSRLGFDVCGSVAADPGVDLEFVADFAAEEVVYWDAQLAGYRSRSESCRKGV